jgi:hypothetical protein
MKTSCYLKINESGSISVSKGKPDLNFDQVAVHLQIELPDILFKKPQITATLKVDEGDATPLIINAETSNNVKDAIETVTGIKVLLKVENPDGTN